MTTMTNESQKLMASAIKSPFKSNDITNNYVTLL